MQNQEEVINEINDEIKKAKAEPEDFEIRQKKKRHKQKQSKPSKKSMGKKYKKEYKSL